MLVHGQKAGGHGRIRTVASKCARIRTVEPALGHLRSAGRFRPWRLRAAGAGPVGQAMAGPLLTIIVKYCDSTSLLVDSLPRGARTSRQNALMGVVLRLRAVRLHRTLVRRSRATGPTINGMASPGTQAFPVYAVRY